MGLGTPAKKHAQVVRVLKFVALAILILIPGYHYVWHRPADLPPKIQAEVLELLPADADMTTLRSQRNPLGYVSTVDSMDDSRSYRVTYSLRSEEYQHTTIVGRVDIGRIASWLITVALLAYLAYRVLFGFLPRILEALARLGEAALRPLSDLLTRILSARCPQCRRTITRETTQLMGSRLVGDRPMPVIMKARDSCPCGYSRTRVYTQAADAVGTVAWMPITYNQSSEMTQAQWHQDLKRLQEEHEGTERTDCDP